MKKLNAREKFWVASSVGACLVAASYFLAYEPLAARLERLDQEIQEKEIVLRRGLELFSKKETLEAEYHSGQRFLTAEGPEEERVVSFLREIGAKAAESSVSLLDLKPQAKAKKTADYKKYLINLSVEGNMEQVLHFIYGIESSEYLLRVERCVLSPRAENSPLLKADIVVSGVILTAK